MPSMNRVILIGYLGDDTKIAQTKSGKSVANFSIATPEKKADDTDVTAWHRVVVWGKYDEECDLRKGDLVVIPEGRLQPRKWEDMDGNTRTVTEVVANYYVKGEGQGAQALSDDDIPF